MTATPYHEYGGLTTVPGPFRCAPSTVYYAPLRADATKLTDLCRTVLTGPDGAAYRPVGEYVLLSFGQITVRPVCPDTSPFYGVPYDEMGTSFEHHAALWIPTEAVHRADRAEFVDRLARFVPAMWVDNPVSLLGGREIYGIAKQWGTPTISFDDPPSCTLDVYGGDFGPDATTAVHRLFEFTPRGGLHPVEAVREAVEEAGEVAGDVLHRLLRGEDTLPAGSLLDEAVRTLTRHQLVEVAARQFRTPDDDGAHGSAVELVEIVTTVETAEAHPVHHGFDFTLLPLDSHPLERTLGIRSQTVPFAVRVTSDFTLSAR